VIEPGVSSAAQASGRQWSPSTPDSESTQPARDSRIGYRPALDGIRAIAVMMVIAYHFDYRWAPGGFLGVDVFFVLSGYLITSLLIHEHGRSGRIDLPQFWLRRARRLFPALIVMMVVVGLWISMTAGPFELAMRREDMIWTAFYGSNWHLILSRQDYFEALAGASPLRHTWSLAVEEQFYLAWPLVVAAAMWLGRKRPNALAVVCLAGIVGSAVAMGWLYEGANPSRAYYGTDARIHQLLIGSLLAVLMRRRPSLARFTRVAAPIALGAAVILVVAVLRLKDQDPAYYLGVSVLLALTTALLVWSIEVNPGQPIARALSLRPVAWVGQISYGLYLWHWPVILMITTAPAWMPELPGATTSLNITRLAVIFAVEIACYYLVEQPIRKGRMPVIGRSGPRLAAAAGIAAVIVVVGTLGWTTARAAGLTQRPIPGCAPFTICLRHQGADSSPVIALVGDSIAQSIDPAMEAIAEELGWTYVIQANSSCRVDSLLAAEVTAADVANLLKCQARTPELRKELLQRWHPDVVVMASFMQQQHLRGAAGRYIERGSEEALRMSEASLGAVAREVTSAGASFILMELPPQSSRNCANSWRFDDPGCTFEVAGHGDGHQARYDAMYERLASAIPGVSALSVKGVLCPDGTCRPVIDGTVMRWDGVHFTAKGALLLAPVLERAILKAGSLQPTR
jgi:peptidoglycan/LPS O-acetylase OafA/YrhL